MNDSFGDRMKRYEDVTNIKLMNLTPVIVRLDGKTFHTLTRKLDKPYDIGFSEAMNSTMWHLLRTVQNCVFGYTSSDEISLLMIEPNFVANSWFDNRVQKIVSIASAEASTFFREYVSRTLGDKEKYRPFRQAIFDARAFNIPRHEVANYFIWRQLDCWRNAVAGAGQSNWSQKQLNGVNSTQIIDKLKNEKNIDFNKDYPQEFIWGKIAYRPPVEMQNRFYTDCMIPACDFRENRQSIESFLPDYI